MLNFLRLKPAVRAVTPQAIYEAAHRVKSWIQVPNNAPRSSVSARRNAVPTTAGTSASFARTKVTAVTIEGMLSEFSMGTLDCLLGLQAAKGINGNIIEFGVYKGRSAAILAPRARLEERIILVDIERRDEIDRIEQLFPAVEFVQSSSEQFPKKLRSLRLADKSCRFIHIDSSHSFRTTLAELTLCERLVSDRGIVALDDFTNLNYSQMIAATFKYLFTAKTDLTLFLVTDEKGYLCRKKDAALFRNYVLHNLLDDMAMRDAPDVCLARTDSDDEYDAFYLRRHNPGESGPYYGLELYQRYYE